jgi:RNA polymerase sigma-70 factor (ECF subfamily)
MSGHAELDAELILQHSGFVRSLARGLLRDESLVDDVVQETLIKALEKGPRNKSALPAWLRTVTRNIVYKTYRGTARRRAREEDAAQPEGLTSTVDIVARGEALENLTASVMDLPESAREVVFLRYYEGLSHAEIGAQLGLASGAVRMRLHRAQKLLQERLDAKSEGGRAAWMSGLAGLAGVGLKDIGGGLTPTNGVAPASSAMMAVAATTMLCLGVGTMFWLGTRPTTVIPGDGLVERSALEAIAPEQDVALLELGDMNGRKRKGAEPDAVPLALIGAAAEASAPAAETSAVFPEGSLQGTVIDELGQPVPGAEVFAAWGRHAMKRQVKTNEQGRFGINVPKKIIDDALNKTYSVLVAATSTKSAPSRVYAWPMEGADDSHGGRHVLLQMRGPGGSITGSVRGMDGRPIVGAEVSLGERSRLGVGFLGQQSAISENRLAPLLAIQVKRGGTPLFQGHRSMRGTLGPQVLEADGTRSRLLPATKRTSKADGTFQFRGLELGQHRVRVSAPGYATYTGHVVVHQGAPSSMALTLESGATLSGTLTREDGLAPTKGLVHVFHRDPYAVQTVRIGSKGQFVLKDLRPGPVRVVAEERLPREKVAQRMVSQNLALSPGESRSITLEMHTPATAQVRVLKRTDGLLEPVTHLTLEVRALANPVDLMASYPLDDQGRATVKLETVRPAEWVVAHGTTLEKGANGTPIEGSGRTLTTPLRRMAPPTREEAAEEIQIVFEERELMAGTVLLTPSVEGAARFDFRDGFALFEHGDPFTYVGWSSGTPGQLQFNGVAPGDYHIMYPHHGLGWISPFTVHVGVATPRGIQDLGALELPKLGSIELVLPQDDPEGGRSTRWTDMDIQQLLPTKRGEVEIVMFRGRAEVPSTVEVSPGQYVLRDPSRPGSPAQYVNVRPGESAELVWR